MGKSFIVMRFLRIEQMNANIAQMRTNEGELRSDSRYENRKFLVQTGQTIIMNVPPYAPSVAPPAKP